MSARVLFVGLMLASVAVTSTASAQFVRRAHQEVRETAVNWLRQNNRFAPNSQFVQDMTNVIDGELADDMNINFFFGRDLMKSGKYQTLHIYCGSVMSFELTPAQAASMDLGSSSASVSTGGSMGKRSADQLFELSNLRIQSADGVTGLRKFRGTVTCKATRPFVQGEYALRVGYRSNAGISQFKWLTVTPSVVGNQIEFEFGPIDEEEDGGNEFRGPLPVMFDLVSVNQSFGDVNINIHSNTVGRIIQVTD